MPTDVGFFLGRERELAELSAALDDAAAGRGALCLVVGEAGIGKTCFAEVFGALAAVRGAQVLRGSCWEGDGAPPYWPWTQVIRALLPALGRGAGSAALPGARYLAGIVPELGERFGGSVPAAALESDTARFQLFDAIAGLLGSASTRKPLVILLDDLHWADAASLHLLRFLDRGALREARVLVVGCHREQENGKASQSLPLLLDLGRNAQRIPLRGLDRRQTAALLCELLAREVDDVLVDAVHRHTEGNPFFVRELAHLLPAGGALHPDHPLPLPDTIRAVIRGRLAPLPEDPLAVLRAASVIGREFDLPCLEQACGLERADLLDRLGPPVRNGIVTPTDSPGRYRFAHVLIRDTLYLDTPPGERAELHRRVGQAIESLRGAEPEPPLSALAHHFEAAAPAGGAPKAIAYARRSAECAMRLLAWEEAARDFGRALALIEGEGIGGRERCGLLLGLGEAWKLSGRRDDAARALEQAAGVARELGDAELLARSARQLGDVGLSPVYTEFGRMNEVLVSLLEEALAALGPAESTLRTRLLARLATELYWADVRERRDRLSDEALASARRLGDEATLGYALFARIVSVATPDNVEERIALEDEILRLARSIGDRELELSALQWRLGDALQLGDEEALGHDLERFLTLVEELRLPRYRWLAPAFRSQLALLQGRPDEAERERGRIMIEAQNVQHQDHAWVDSAIFFGILREEGRLGEIEGALRQLVIQESMGAVWPSALAFLYAEIGRREEALAAIEKLAPGRFATLRRDVTFLFCAGALAEAVWLLEEPRYAEELRALLSPYADRLVLTGPAMIYCFGPVRHHLGCLATLSGRSTEAVDHFTAALATSDRLGMLVLAARTRVAFARSLLAQGARERALALLDEAAATADELDLAGLRARVETVRSLADRRAATPPPLVAESRILHRDGADWTAVWEGRCVMLRDAKSLHYLHALVRSPGRSLACPDLVREIEGGEAALPDDDRSAERARVKTRRLLRSAIDAIRREHPSLGKHLGEAIRTGTRCSYDPRP